MADNYLEKRMEELRSGRGSQRPTATQSLRPLNLRRKLILDFPPQRVLILAGTDTTLSHPIAKAFRTTDSKTALYDHSLEASTQLAQQSGIRHAYITPYSENSHAQVSENESVQVPGNQTTQYTGNDSTNPATTDLIQKFETLIKAWRDLDIVIILPEALPYLPLLLHLWTIHKSRYPIPTDYQPRLLAVTTPACSLPTIPLQSVPQPHSDPSSIPPIQITQIQIPTTPTSEQLKSLQSTLLYLSLPESTHLSTPLLKIQ